MCVKFGDWKHGAVSEIFASKGPIRKKKNNNKKKG